MNVSEICNKLSTTKYSEKRLKPKSSDSESCDLTHVTTGEIAENNEENDASRPEVDATNAFRIRLQEESMEINKKCMKWLEGVAKERLQNPDQIFLPHLLIS